MFDGWQTLFLSLFLAFALGLWFHRRTNTPFLPTVGMRLLVAVTTFGWGIFYVLENNAFGASAAASRVHGALMIITGLWVILTTPNRAAWPSRIGAAAIFALMLRLAYLASFERPSGVYTFVVWALIMLNEVLAYAPYREQP